MAGRRVWAVQAFRRRQNHKKGHTHQVWPFYGGDYWTRTSDLLRVKIRLDIKRLLLGAFRYFLLRFFGTDRRSLSTASTR